MTLRRLQVTDFRCLRSAELHFDSDFTLVSGANASGKTSLLEAIFVLGRGRSFRTRRLDNLIRAGSARFVVFGEVLTVDRRIALGVEGSVAGVRARIGGEAVASLADLAAVFPAQVIDPEVHRLIEEGPGQRRRFLDWGVFHVEHGFIGAWRGYQQVLRQRNAALRARSPKGVVSAWDGELIRWGNCVSDARAAYVAHLAVPAAQICHRLLGLDLSLTYRPGWKQDEGFEAALAASYARDVEIGSTLVGPQRAELSIRLNGQPVKDRVSRGQQKLLASALLLAQISLFESTADSRPILLLDDPAAELDSERLVGLIREVTSQKVQLIVTSLNPDFAAFGCPGRQFVVEEGGIRER